MDKVKHKIILDLINQRITRPIKIQKKNTVDVIYIYLREQNVPYKINASATAVLKAVKPDGSILFNCCDIEETGDCVIYNVTNQTICSPGIVECQLELFDGEDEVLISPVFEIEAGENLFEDGAIESTNEFTALTRAMLSFPKWWFGTRAEYNELPEERKAFELYFIEEGT